MPTITTTYKGDMLFQSQVGNHAVLIDVPPTMGGKDRASTPPDYFVVSLGSCVAALVANYCGKSGIDAEDLTVTVTYDKADNPTRLTNIRVRVELPNARCQDREAAIRRVAEHCPVHQTIELMDDVTFEILDQEALQPAP